MQIDSVSIRLSEPCPVLGDKCRPVRCLGNARASLIDRGPGPLAVNADIDQDIVGCVRGVKAQPKAVCCGGVTAKSFWVISYSS